MTWPASLGALAVLAAFAVACWGWGRLTLRACGLDSRDGAAYAAVLGLATLGAAGGWLNLLGIAYAPVLWLLLLAGWVEVALAARRRSSPSGAWLAGDRRVLIFAGVIAAAAVALSIVLLPSAAFNPFDDFQLYFPRPLRMLQAGSLGSNPFNMIGLDSLGVHAFLQAFPLLVLPVAYFNAFDAVLCALLVLALAASIGARLGLGAPVVIAALAATVFVPALQANVSALYALSAFALALAPALSALLDPAPAQGSLWRRAVPVGLLLAALAASKGTTLSFLLCWGSCFVVVAALTRDWRTVWRSGGATAAASAVFLLPWAALHAGNYAAWFSHRAAAVAGESAVGSFFSALRWSWAGNLPKYDAIAAILLAAVAAAAWRSRGATAAERVQILPLAALCAAAAATYAANTQLPIDAHHAMRYSAPALIAAVPAAVLLAAYACAPAGLAPALGMPLLLGILLAGPASERVRAALEYRSVLAFPEGDLAQHRRISAWGLARETREWMVRAQAHTEPGQVVLAFTLFPYDLLYARNPVLVVSPLGLIAPWLDVPAGTDAGAFREFLARYRVRYVIWHAAGRFQSDDIIAQGLASPVEAERFGSRRLLWLRTSLENLAKSATVVHSEDGLLVIDLGAAR